MTVVVDASVALKWVLPEADTDLAIALLSSSELTAPDIFVVEAANALWRHVVRKELNVAEAQSRLSKLRSVPITRTASDDDIDGALRLAADLSHPVYDCIYLALALRLDTYVVTADNRFAALAGRRADLADRVRSLA